MMFFWLLICGLVLSLIVALWGECLFRRAEGMAYRPVVKL